MTTVKQTIEHSLLHATRLLDEASIESPRLDADLLLQEVLKLNRLELCLARARELADTDREQFLNLVARRCAHEPLAYIIGRKEFYGYDFTVSPACLIPRPDTEIVVEECLKRLTAKSDELVVDMCTGSGAIAIALLKERPSITAVAADISPSALDVARTNARDLHVAHRVTLVESDLFASVTLPNKAAIVVSNPPYIRRDDVQALDKTVRDYEPLGALDGDHDGLIFYRRLVVDAKAFVRPGGFLILEIGYDQARDVLAFVDEDWRNPQVIKDLGQRDRCIVLQLSAHGEKPETYPLLGLD